MALRSRPKSSCFKNTVTPDIMRISTVKVQPYTSQNSDIEDRNDKQLLRSWLKPFFISLSILGLAHERTLEDKRSIKQFLAFIHSLVINMILWGNCVRLLGLFSNLSFKLDWILVGKLTVLSYNAHCAISSTIVFYTFTNPNYLKSYLTKWKSDFQDIYEDISLYEKSLKPGIFTVTVVCWFLFIGTSLATFYAFLFTPLYDTALVPFAPDHEHAKLIKTIIFFTVTIRTSASGVFAHGMVVIMSWQVAKMCDFHQKMFCKAIDADGKLRGNIEDLRRKHNDISRLIECADRFMSMHNSETFILMIALVCLVMYGLIYYPETRATPVVTLMSMWYLFTFTSYLAIVCISSAYVNSKAHMLYEILHSLNLEDETPERITQISVFLNRLSAQPIGFSALKMFVIDRPTILTILGLLLSYVIVMLQFKPDNENVPIATNSTT